MIGLSQTFPYSNVALMAKSLSQTFPLRRVTGKQKDTEHFDRPLPRRRAKSEPPYLAWWYKRFVPFLHLQNISFASNVYFSARHVAENFGKHPDVKPP